MKRAELCRIVSKKEIIPDIFDVIVESPQIAAEAKPGQFLHIDCGDGIQTFLRRPISICDAFDTSVRFLFRRTGSGTSVLAQKQPGDTLDILGPLGNPFTLLPQAQKPILIGGGIGIFPLYLLCKQLNGARVLLGFQSKDKVLMEEEFQALAETTVATDDGSYGYNGYAVNLLEELLKQEEGDIVYSCGPTPMLKAVQRITQQYGVKCQLSLEQRMGCGIGACLTCTCETTSKGVHQHKRVCKNGPVFWSSEVIL